MKLWLILFLLPSLAQALPSLEGEKPLRNPIVLVHGATVKGSRLQIGFLDFGEYFRGIKEFYSATRTPVYVAELSTDGSIGERAAVLKNFLETDLKGKPVNIVAHSLGGLDARFLATIFKSKQIVSITTIGTPHKGTPLANWAARQIDGRGFWYWFFRVLGYDMEQRHFLKELTTDSMARFNPRVPDQPGIRYYSVRTKASFAAKNMSYFLWFPAHWLEAEAHSLAQQGHDGMVPFDSQGWGREIATLELDHLGQMNHHGGRFLDEEEKSLQMYKLIYENLQREGF